MSVYAHTEDEVLLEVLDIEMGYASFSQNGCLNGAFQISLKKLCAIDEVHYESLVIGDFVKFKVSGKGCNLTPIPM